VTFTVTGYVEDGKVVPTRELPATPGKARCLVTVFDESIEDLQAQAAAVIAPEKQQRVSELLAGNGEGRLSQEEEKELDALLAEAHEIDVHKAEAVRLLRELEHQTDQ
jgi:hypothetical protein